MNYFRLIELIGKLAAHINELKNLTVIQYISLGGSTAVAYASVMLAGGSEMDAVVSGLGALTIALAHLVQTSPIGRNQ